MAELKLELEGWEDRHVFLRFTSMDESVVIEIPDPRKPKLKEARTEISIPLGDLASAKWQKNFLPLTPSKLTLEMKSVKNAGPLPLQDDTQLIFLIPRKLAEDAEALAKELRFSIMHESLEDMLDITDL